jgi:hypothetical protein
MSEKLGTRPRSFIYGNICFEFSARFIRSVARSYSIKIHICTRMGAFCSTLQYTVTLQIAGNVSIVNRVYN